MSDKAVDSASAATTRLQIMESLVPVVVGKIAEQLQGFVERLCAALLRHSEQSVQPKEANLSFNASNYLKKNSATFQCDLIATLTSALLREIAALHQIGSIADHHHQHDLALVSLEEMENKVLIGSISQAIELKNSSALVALNFRLGRLLQQPDFCMTHNPFRPAVCVRAVFDAWCTFDPTNDSHRLILRLFQSDLFFDFEPPLTAINEALVAQGIVPDLAEAYRRSRTPRQSQDVVAGQGGEASLHQKIQRWLHKTEGSMNEYLHDDVVSDAKPAARSGAAANIKPAAISARASAATQRADASLLTFLLEQQRADKPARVTTLRDIARTAPAGLFGASDHNTIELLARIFDFIFASGQIPSEIKNLLGQLQMPLLQTALLDEEFFHSELHPARRLLDQLAQSSIGAPVPVDINDPLYKLIEQIVDRVQHEFDQQISMFSDVVADMASDIGGDVGGDAALDSTADASSHPSVDPAPNLASNLTSDLTADLTSYIADQQRGAEVAVRAHINQALHEEKMRHAQMAAADDIAARIETGEVAGFVERFLETQWLRVLTLTHSVAERKPKALANARNAMDELIWSVKPKVSTDERAELISKLPAMLSLINAWLNVIKWDEPARVTFFSRLVERHAAIVQQPVELSPRHQLHLAVNVAQKASERRLSRRARELEAPPADQFVQLVDTLKAGAWIEFIRHNGVPAAFRLVWVSPLRSRFIFCNRQSDEPFSFTAEELAVALREQGASLIPHEALSTRALLAALQDMDESD